MATALKSSAMVALLAANVAIFMAASLGAAANYVHIPKKCDSKLSSVCGRELSDGVFKNKTISDGCCYQLVNKLGFNCYKEVAYILVNAPQVKAHATEVLLKGLDIWDTCNSKTPSSCIKV